MCMENGRRRGRTISSDKQAGRACNGVRANGARLGRFDSSCSAQTCLTVRPWLPLNLTLPDLPSRLPAPHGQGQDVYLRHNLPALAGSLHGHPSINTAVDRPLPASPSVSLPPPCLPSHFPLRLPLMLMLMLLRPPSE